MVTLCLRITNSFSRRVPVFLSPTTKSLYDAIHKEGAAPASTAKRLAIELAIVKAKAVSGETDLRWIDARYQIADFLTKHASRMSEAVLQNSAGCTVENYCRRGHAGQTQTRARDSEQFFLWRRTEAYERMTRWCRWVAGKKNFEECESGCAFHGITNFVTNTLMKVQHVAVSENSVHNSCVLCTVIWTWRFVLSRQT